MKFFKKSRSPTIPGELIEDYGLVDEFRRGIVRFKHSVLLVEKYGKNKVIIREDTTLIGQEAINFEFDKEGARRLKEVLDKAIRRM